jgi:amino acid transporter
VKNPKHAVPRAIVYSLLGVAAVLLLTSFAIILAMPDLQQILAASEGDPIIAILAYHFPPIVVKVIRLCVFQVGVVGSRPPAIRSIRSR